MPLFVTSIFSRCGRCIAEPLRRSFRDLFDLLGMILAGMIAVYRRFIARQHLQTSVGDLVAVNLLGGWLSRFFCEAISILTYSLPNSVAGIGCILRLSKSLLLWASVVLF